MITKDEAFYGTEKKYLIEVESAGFDMHRDEFEVVIKRGGHTIVIPKSDLVVEPYTVTVDNEQETRYHYYVLFNTKDTGKGDVSAVITAHVPDTDFPDGIRDEVIKLDFLYVNGV